MGLTKTAQPSAPLARWATWLSLATCALSHMMIQFPAPIRSKFDSGTSTVDYDYTAPLHSDGSNFPCKGYQKNMGRSSATFKAGNTYNVTFAGSAVHNGGTCQLTISTDGGNTFKVIKTIIGGCPLPNSGHFDFRIPDYIPQKNNALFAWSWINHSGNREFYMDCSWVDIRNSGAPSQEKWQALPDIFVAQLKGVNSCAIPEGTDPVPKRVGPDVEYRGKETPSSAKWQQDCEWRGSGSSAPNPAQEADGFIGNPGGSFAEAAMPHSQAPNTHVRGGGEVIPLHVDSGAGLTPASCTTSSSCITPTVTVTVTPVPAPGSGSSSPPSTIRFANAADTSQFLPCVPGSFLCTSETTFMTCDNAPAARKKTKRASYAWTASRSVAAGMSCQPNLSPLSGAGGQMPGAPQGQMRDDRYVRAQPNGGCTESGSYKCAAGGRSFMVCAQGAWVDMGATAQGTLCQDGKIIAG